MNHSEAHDGRSWDKYSDQWGELEESGLGVEWGTGELTLRVFENCLRPLLGPDKEVLEIGPGGGKYSVLAAPHCARLICADVSTQMLSRARKALSDRDNVEMLQLGGVDLAGLPDESLDLAFSIDVFVHLDLEDVYGYLREFHRVLRPGSPVVLHFASYQSPSGWGRFHRIADYNRAMRRQVGRINFVTPEIVTELFRQVRFAGIEVDTTSASDRDFVVTAHKPELPEDPEHGAREDRILQRSGSEVIAIDFIGRLGYGVLAPSPSSPLRTEWLTHEDDSRQVLVAQPDARAGFSITIPPGSVLCTGLALHPDAQVGGSDNAVTFLVQVVHAKGIVTLLSHQLEPGDASRWFDFELDLEEFAGEVVFLVLETRTAEGTLANGACWAEPAIVRRSTADGRAPASPPVDRIEFHDPVAERDNLLRHVATIEHERDALQGHVGNVEEELAAFQDHARTLERDITKIRKNPVYRALCRVRDLFVRPQT